MSRAHNEELRIRIPAELMAKHPKRAGAIAEIAGDLLGGLIFEEVGAQGLVHTLARLGRLREETAALRYVFRCAYSHKCIVAHVIPTCQGLFTEKR